MDLPKIPELELVLLTDKVGDNFVVTGYQWNYPDGSKDVQEIGIYPAPIGLNNLLKRIEEMKYWPVWWRQNQWVHVESAQAELKMAPISGIPGIPLPVHRRNDIPAGEYQIIPDRGPVSTVKYVNVGDDKQYVYKDGLAKDIEEYYFNRREIYFNQGIQTAFIIYQSTHDEGTITSEAFEYQNGLMTVAMKYSSGAPQLRLYNEDGSEKVWEYPFVEDSKRIAAVIKDGKLVLSIPHQAESYWTNIGGKLEGPFKYHTNDNVALDAEGTFNGQLDAVNRGDQIGDIIETKDPREYAEGYLRINDKEYYVSGSKVLPYQVWLDLIGEKVGGSFDTLKVPEVSRLVAEYIREIPKEELLLPSGGYQGIIKENIGHVLGKQQPVTEAILKYL